MQGIYAHSAEAIARMAQTGGDKELTTLLSIRSAASNVVAADLYVRIYANDGERRAIGPDDDWVAAARKQIEALRDHHPWTFIVDLEKAMLSFVRNESSPERTHEEFAALKARADEAGVQMTRLDEKELDDFKHRVSNAIEANMNPSTERYRQLTPSTRTSESAIRRSLTDEFFNTTGPSLTPWWRSGMSAVEAAEVYR